MNKQQSTVTTEYIVTELCGRTAEILGQHIEGICKKNEPSFGSHYFGIIGCACFFEAVLDEAAVRWCKTDYPSRSKDVTIILGNLAEEVERTTGLDGWKKTLQKIFDIDISKILVDEWECLTILFQLRNLLAHGKGPKFRHVHDLEGKWLGVDSNLPKSYVKIIKFLQKNKLFIIGRDSPSIESFLKFSTLVLFVKTVNSSLNKLQKTSPLSKLMSYNPIGYDKEVIDKDYAGFNPRDYDLIEKICDDEVS